MDEDGGRLKSQIEAARKREATEREGLRPILSGASGFVATIEAQIGQLDALARELAELHQTGTSYESQLEEVQAMRTELATLGEQARNIAGSVRGAATTALKPEQIAAIWRDRIRPLLEAEIRRRATALRIQGPLVEIRQEVGDDCQGLLFDATATALDYVNEIVSDLHSPLRHLWRWLERDTVGRPVLWLYSHHPTEKWKCLFFRIVFGRLADKITFRLESYVPFGFGADPAQYEMQSSNVFIRPGWRSVDVTSASYNRANTYSINTSVTQSSGTSFGVNAGYSDSRSEGSNTSVSSNTSYSASLSDTFSTSWFDNQGYSSGGFGQPGTFSSGSGSGGGTARSEGIQLGSGTSESSGTSSGRTEGESWGVNAGQNEGIAVSVGEGITWTSGEGLQVQSWAYGIDLGKSADQHLRQWRNGNPDAAEIYDLVIAAFGAMTKHVITRLQNANFGTVDTARTELATRWGELGRRVLLEPEAPARKVLPRPAPG